MKRKTLGSETHTERTDTSVILRTAIIGDCEPKPNPVFINLERAAGAINLLHADRPLDFTIGIGDLAHKGKKEQYEASTPLLQQLAVPFYAILGNEELGGGTERFFAYARTWNDEPDAIPAVNYIRVHNGLLLLFATALENGKEFRTEEIDWIVDQLRAHAGLPALLFVHAAPKDVFPEGKAMKVNNFDRVLQEPNVAAVFSGHSHMSLDEVPTYAQDEWGNHHIHVPGIERTKLGEEHVPRFRVLTVEEGGESLVETYNLKTERFEDEFAIRFMIEGP